MNKYTPVEQKIFDGWKKQIPGIKIDTQIDFIREHTKEVAFHEAGHAAANAFFGENFTHFEKLTIIPSPEYMGCLSHSNVFKCSLASYEGRLKWIKGWPKILELLAGRMAEKRINNDIQPIEDEISEGWENTLAESEEEWLLTTDEGKAFKVAGQMPDTI